MAFNISYVYIAKDRFSAVARRVSRAANRVRARMRLLRRSTKGAGDAFDNMGAKFAKFVALAATLAIFALPIKQAIEFESALSDLNKVMEFELPDGLERTGEALQNLSRRIPITTKGLVEIATAGGQVGVAQKDILKFVETVSKISIAFDLLPGETAKSIAKLSNIFQIPIGEMESFADSINLLSNTTLAEAGDIIVALANKGAAAGSSLGLSARETLGFATALIETGVNANRVGSIMDSMARRLTDASKLGEPFVEELIENPRKRVVLLFRQLNKLKGAKKTQAFAEIFGEFGLRVEILAKTMDNILIPTLKRATNIQEAAGSIQEEFAVRLATTNSKLIILGNKFNVAGQSIGVGFLPAVNAGAAALGFIADVIATVVRNTGPLVPMLLAAAAAIAIVKIATLAWAVAAAILSVSLGPVTLIVAGIAAAIVGVAFLINKIKGLGGFEVVFKKIGNFIIDFIVTPFLLAAKAIDAITGSDFASKIESFQASIKFDVPAIPDDTIAGATNKTETEVNVNLNAPPGIIQSVESRTKGQGRTNIGQNLVMVGAG